MTRRLGDLLSRGGGVHVDGRDVEAEVGRDLLEVEPADAGDALARARVRGVESWKSSRVHRLHCPAFSTILLPLDLQHCRIGLAVAVDQELDCDRGGRLEQAIVGTDDPHPGRVVVEGQAGRLPPPSSIGLIGPVLGEVLIGAVGAQHVGRAHAAEAAVVAVVRGAGGVV